ncbi:RNA-binding protein (macronuclear) [Tetrahymena thermophila SB210]|uniref:RNA-binding protein n=1 Tax=Tetrahymena thermophila (strain SB210) TaxID=312017 RepID=I7LWP0_TETTS|nr:RNA-binding protein [Tetrahymena thermophila SB210]EAS02444.2 RNA-binding protein [Tetrahymena thermophila SB210]|eukprot:XP_001022689.2 RNA-binding protein [Tetrahymena thermophila SB210]
MESVIHITNLTPEITIDEIKETYAKSGTINKIILGRNEALVFFSDEDEAESALVFTNIGEIEVEVNQATTLTLNDVVQTFDHNETQESTKEAGQSNISSSVNDYEVITHSQIKQETVVEQLIAPQVEVRNEVEARNEAETLKTEQVRQVVVEEAKDQVNKIQEQAEIKVEQVQEKLAQWTENIERQPLQVQHDQQAVVEEYKPVVVEQPKTVIVEQPKQVQVEEIRQVVVEEPKREVVEQPRKIVEEPQITKVEEPKHVEQIRQVEVQVPVAQSIQAKAEEKTQVCPPESKPQVCPYAAGSCSTSSTNSTINSVQLLNALKNTSLPERSKPVASDVFQNVFNPNFLSGLVGLLIAITIFSQIF